MRDKQGCLIVQLVVKCRQHHGRCPLELCGVELWRQGQGGAQMNRTSSPWMIGDVAHRPTEGSQEGNKRRSRLRDVAVSQGL